MTDERAAKRRRLSLATRDENQLYDTNTSFQDTRDKTTFTSRADHGTSTLLTQPISPPSRKNVRKGIEQPNEDPLFSGPVSPLLLSIEGKTNELIYTQKALEAKIPVQIVAKEIDEIPDDRLLASSFSAVDQESSRLPYNRTSLQDANAPLYAGEKHSGTSTRIIPSPVELNRIEGLSDYSNLDTVSLRDIVGDPLIKECWVFNYLFDVDFLLSNFDEDVQEVVEIKLVHGSWKKEDSNRQGIEEATKRYKNIKSITAHMPEAFGTHHSKMIINIRHDDTAQVNILTANILTIDWKMSQAVWRSPLLPLLDWPFERAQSSSNLPAIGTGSRFKIDLIAYLKQYGSRLRELINQLEVYCFDNVKAALIASVPGRQNLTDIDPEQETLWGWPGLRNILRKIPPTSNSKPHIVMQVSSVASLGSGDSWLRQTFQDALSAATNNNQSLHAQQKPKFSLVFPTADSVRRSIDGYRSGGSIHMKTHTTQGIKQLEYIRPMLCHWAKDNQHNSYVPTPALGSIDSGASKSSMRRVGNAGRQRTVPHIKTYMRFADEGMNRIDWAIMTSANLSTQAWGAKVNAAKEVRVCSYEIGVVIWPGLWNELAEMVPVFGTNEPDSNQVKEAQKKGEAGRDVELTEQQVHTLIGIRMPYDLPLIPYSEDEVPWCAAKPDNEPDWKLRVWAGYGLV